MARVILILALSGLALTGCGGTDSTSDDRPSLVVTTSILGDVVSTLVGEEAAVEVIIPPGADPHDFQASAQQVDAIRRADALVVNGGGFEESIEDVLDSATADGVPTFDVLVEGAGHDDPHFFTDPVLVAAAVPHLVTFLSDAGIVSDALDRRAADLVAELDALDREIAEILDVVPDDRRVLVTSHDVFGPFAARYDFALGGSVLRSGVTTDGASARGLSELADAVAQTGLPAVFADSSSPDDLLRAVADEVGDIAVVALYSESLGEPGSGADTYPAMMRTNAQRIADALGG